MARLPSVHCLASTRPGSQCNPNHTLTTLVRAIQCKSPDSLCPTRFGFTQPQTQRIACSTNMHSWLACRRAAPQALPHLLVSPRALRAPHSLPPMPAHPAPFWALPGKTVQNVPPERTIYIIYAFAFALNRPTRFFTPPAHHEPLKPQASAGLAWARLNPSIANLNPPQTKTFCTNLQSSKRFQECFARE